MADNDKCPYSMNQVILEPEDEVAMDRLWQLCLESKDTEGEIGNFYRRVHGVLARLGEQHQAMHDQLHNQEQLIERLRAREQALKFLTVSARGQA